MLGEQCVVVGGVGSHRNGVVAKLSFINNLEVVALNACTLLYKVIVNDTALSPGVHVYKSGISVAEVDSRNCADIVKIRGERLVAARGHGCVHIACHEYGDIIACLFLDQSQNSDCLRTANIIACGIKVRADIEEPLTCCFHTELDANYIGNTFAGIVHLNKQYSTGDDAKFKVTIDGTLIFETKAEGLKIVRQCFPSTELRSVYEIVTVTNESMTFSA